MEKIGKKDKRLKFWTKKVQSQNSKPSDRQDDPKNPQRGSGRKVRGGCPISRGQGKKSFHQPKPQKKTSEKSKKGDEKKTITSISSRKNLQVRSDLRINEAYQ